MNNGISEIAFKVSIQWKGHTFTSAAHFFLCAKNIHNPNVDFIFSFTLVLLFSYKNSLSESLSDSLLPSVSVLEPLSPLSPPPSHKSWPYTATVTSPWAFLPLFFSVYQPSSPLSGILSLIPKCCFPLSTLPVSFPLLSLWCRDGHHSNCLEEWRVAYWGWGAAGGGGKKTIIACLKGLATTWWGGTLSDTSESSISHIQRHMHEVHMNAYRNTNTTTCTMNVHAPPPPTFSLLHAHTHRRVTTTKELSVQEHYCWEAYSIIGNGVLRLPVDSHIKRVN